MTVPVTGITPVYGIEYLVAGEPATNTRAKLQRNAEQIEAALAARGVPPADLQALIAAGWFTDSGWVNCTVRATFAANGTPQVRRRGGVVMLRNGFTNTGLAISNAYTVGDLPAGFAPPVNLYQPAGMDNGSRTGEFVFGTAGTIELRTGPTLSGYYRMDPCGWFTN